MVNRPILFAIATTCALALAPGLALAAENFSAALTGSQQVGPVDTTANGSAQLLLNDDANALSMVIQITGLDLDGNQTADPDDDVVAMHIHAAPAGLNGGVVFGLISPNNDLDGDLVIDPVAGTITSVWDGAEGNGTTLAAQLNNLRSSGLYFNVHTPANPGGEIRGQIGPSPGSAVPTLSQWGLIAMLGSIALLAGWYLRRRPN